jgi:hypothetical protein
MSDEKLNVPGVEEYECDCCGSELVMAFGDPNPSGWCEFCEDCTFCNPEWEL